MTEQSNVALSNYAPPTMLYYKEVESAARILKCGVPDLIVWIASTERNSLENAASICCNSTEMQRAACDIARYQRNHLLLKEVVDALNDARQTQEWQSNNPFPMNLCTVHLYKYDYELATQIKDCAEPDLLVILDRGWARLKEVREACDEHPVVQQEASKFMWIRNRTGKTLELADAISQMKNTPETPK